MKLRKEDKRLFGKQKKMTIVGKVKLFGCGLVVLVLSLLAGLYFYYRSYYNKAVSTPNSNDSSEVLVVIAPGDSTQQISEKLVEAGVLTDKKMPDGRYVFQWYLSFDAEDKVIQAGNFYLPKNLTMPQLVDQLQEARSKDLWVTVIEGTRIEEIAESIDKVMNAEDNINDSKFNKEEFISLARSKDTRYEGYEFMQYVPEGETLEGYLFPDSYLVERDATTETILKLMLSTFERKVYQAYKAEISNNKYSLNELVILASIVEREGKGADDRKMIADIMFRRLETPGWLLEVDATLQYGLGYDEESESWWPKNLPSRYTVNDYNTSVNEGLPPGPICSFGVQSFEAVLRPTSNTYWFYIHDENSQPHYAETLEEHNRNINEYLR